MERLSLSARRFLDHSFFGTLLDMALASISLLYVASYIATTYIPASTVRTSSMTISQWPLVSCVGDLFTVTILALACRDLVRSDVYG
jgi:hypothetical protein